MPIGPANPEHWAVGRYWTLIYHHGVKVGEITYVITDVAAADDTDDPDDTVTEDVAEDDTDTEDAADNAEEAGAD